MRCMDPWKIVFKHCIMFDESIVSGSLHPNQIYRLSETHFMIIFDDDTPPIYLEGDAYQILFELYVLLEGRFQVLQKQYDTLKTEYESWFKRH